MAKGMIILILLIIIFVLGVLIFLELEPEEEEPGVNEELGELASIKSSPPGNESFPLENENVSGENGEIVSGGGGGSGSSSGDASSEETPEPLPADLHTAPCGTYFTRYDICTGSCDEGICTNEGRSCYCKKT